jgi:hypothetical protein
MPGSLWRWTAVVVVMISIASVATGCAIGMFTDGDDGHPVFGCTDEPERRSHCLRLTGCRETPEMTVVMNGSSDATSVLPG